MRQVMGNARRAAGVGLGVAALIVLCGAQARAAELRLGFVNVGKVFDEYQGTKDSEAGLEAHGKQKQAQLEAQFNALKDMRKDLELASDQARESKAREIEEKSDEFKRQKSRAERELLMQRNQVARKILDEINGVIAEFAKANSFSLILDQRSVVYGEETYEVTDQVLKILNERYAAKAGAAAKKKP